MHGLMREGRRKPVFYTSQAQLHFYTGRFGNFCYRVEFSAHQACEFCRPHARRFAGKLVELLAHIVRGACLRDVHPKLVHNVKRHASGGPYAEQQGIFEFFTVVSERFRQSPAMGARNLLMSEPFIHLQTFTYCMDKFVVAQISLPIEVFPHALATNTLLHELDVVLDMPLRIGRERIIFVFTTASGVATCLRGFAAGLPSAVVFALMCVHYDLMLGDSAALTAGAIGSAHADQHGAMMVVYSFIGFSAAMVAPLVFGTVPDIAGGNRSTLAWLLAYVSIGVFGAAAPMVQALY